MQVDIVFKLAIVALAFSIVPLPETIWRCICFFFPAVRRPTTRMRHLRHRIESIQRLLDKNQPPVQETTLDSWKKVTELADEVELQIEGYINGWPRFPIGHFIFWMTEDNKTIRKNLKNLATEVGGFCNEHLRKLSSQGQTPTPGADPPFTGELESKPPGEQQGDGQRRSATDVQSSSRADINHLLEPSLESRPHTAQSQARSDETEASPDPHSEHDRPLSGTSRIPLPGSRPSSSFSSYTQSPLGLHLTDLPDTLPPPGSPTVSEYHGSEASGTEYGSPALLMGRVGSRLPDSLPPTPPPPPPMRLRSPPHQSPRRAAGPLRHRDSRPTSPAYGTSAAPDRNA